VDVLAVVAWIGAAVAGVGILTAAWRITRGAGRILRGLVHFLDDWGGEPGRPGKPARPGVIEQLADHSNRLGAVESRLSRVDNQLKPNGGSSLRDAIDRVEAAVVPDPPDPGEVNRG
jgi:hypothetical protein